MKCKSGIFSLMVFFAVMQVHAQVLPSPMYSRAVDGFFNLENEIRISSPVNKKLWFKNTIRQMELATGKVFNLTESEVVDGIILTDEGADATLGKEGYLLEIDKHKVVLRAETEAGFFYGMQTVMQLFPPEIYADQLAVGIRWRLPCVIIKDSPKYGYRSFMLDSGRQYQSIAFIKRYLDYMAMLKMNVFHWHLTEGQGWRIEIKKYPLLTEIGSQVAKGEEQQGYYTQEEIREIVKYAADRFITVVPEIDVPGHSEAALIAYPEYTCSGKAPKSVMAFSDVIFCAGKEKTYDFIEDVLDEVCALFPGPYIHLGGDEAPKGQWKLCQDCQSKIKDNKLQNEGELQLLFSKRLASYLEKLGKDVIFWGDVVHEEGVQLPSNVIVQWWNYRRHKDLEHRNAVKGNYRVIAGTNYYSYLNFPTTAWSKYKMSRTMDLRDIYENNPSDLMSPNSLVLGMSASLWTDWHVQEHMVDRRVFPRIFALAEQMWSKGKRKPFDEFYSTLKTKYKMLEALGINYGPALTEETPVDYKWD